MREYFPSGPGGVPMDPDEMRGHDEHVCEEWDVDIDKDGQMIVNCHECGAEPDDPAIIAEIREENQ